MRSIRNCTTALLNTGISKCPIDFGKIKGAIIVPHGNKLDWLNILGKAGTQALIDACHNAPSGRIYPVKTFVEYAKDGGEPQVSAVGYGGNKVNNVSARTDTFTLDSFNESLNASLLKTMNKPFDAYYVDENGFIYGQNDGTDNLAGIPMSTIYPKATPHPTSSAKATLDVCFCLKDVQDSEERYDYVQLDFDPLMAIQGLTQVDLVKTEGSKYKIVETIGGYDRTEEFGPTLARDTGTLIIGASAVSYNASDKTLSITASGTPKLAEPGTLNENGIRFIEQL